MIQRRETMLVRKYFLRVFLALFITTNTPLLLAQECVEQKSVNASVYRLPEHEELVYEIRWSGFVVGTAKASINGIKKIRGRDAYEISVRVQLSDFCFGMFKLDDRYVTYMDVEGLCVLREEAYCPEGRCKKNMIIDFDNINHKAYCNDVLNGSAQVIDIPSGIEDTITMVYYFRTLPVQAGKTKAFPLYNNKLVYEVYAEIDNKIPGNVSWRGAKNLFRMQPYTILKGDAPKKENMQYFFSNDENRVPCLVVISGPAFSQLMISLVNNDVAGKG